MKVFLSITLSRWSEICGEFGSFLLMLELSEKRFFLRIFQFFTRYMEKLYLLYITL